MRILLSFLIICCTPLLSFSQNDWRTMIGNPDIDFTTIQESFYAEFGDEIGEKGSGWKQFKRWEHYQEQRLDALGNYPEPGNVLSEMLKYQETHPITKTYTLGSGNWELLGPTLVPDNGTGQPNGNGRITCIAFHPTDPNTIYVGAPSGGVWKSINNGASWTQYISGLTRLGISSIVIHPTNPDTIYVGTGDRDAGDAPGYGVWASTDGGLTWNSRNNGMGNRTTNEILMDPNNSSILIAATSSSRMYRTTDGGANWTQTANLGYTAKDIAFHPSNSNIVYASGTGFHKSVDGGVTWTQITSGVPTGVSRIAMAVSVNEPNWVYLLAADGSGLDGVYRSTNSGTNFTLRTASPNIMGWDVTGGTGSQAWYDIVIAADPTDANTIYTGGINIWKSTDGGANMSLTAHWVGSGGADDVHADHHALDFSPHNNNLYNGNDGGLYVTTDNGVNWNDLSDGLAIAQIFKIGVSQQTHDKAINGYQDNGTAINTGTSFITEIGGDGMECIIDPTDDTYMYGALYYGNIRRSTNGGNSFGTISGPTGEGGGWVTPYKLDPNDANRMFAGFDDIWRNDAVRTTTTWTQISSFANSSNMVDIAIAPSNSNVMYVSKGGSSNFYRTTNALAASPTWTDLEANLPTSGTPRDIEIDHTDPTHIFISIGNNIYESSDSGLSWTDISGTLPNISLNTILIDKDSPSEAMYVGMDVGVYYIDNNLADWVLYSNGLPNLEVTELEIHYNGSECKSTLYASTYGLGLWKSDLKDPGNLATVACFEASSTEICMGETVTFKDNTSYTPTSWAWTITPNTFTFVGGTNVNSQNPQVNFSAAGTYTVQLNTSNSTGNDIENKGSYITVSSADPASSFNNDFESESTCAVTTNCGTTTCPLTNPLWINLNNGTEDDIDWRVDNGGTVSGGTGPSVDFNPGTVTGNYAYLEASGGCNGQIALLQTSCLTIDQNYDFVFRHHLLGDDIGSLHLDINISGEWTLDIIPAIEGNQGDLWETSTASLAAYIGQTVKFRIRGITGTGFESDIAIDDIALVPVVLLPVTLLSFDAEVHDNNSVKLEWATATELNTAFYEIQRSRDAKNWISIHKEDAAGNSNSLLNYEAWDLNPLKGVSYYRLKDVDFDGPFSFSKNQSVNIGSLSNSDIRVFPNPTDNEITITGNGIDFSQVKFYNLLGQDVSRFTLQKSNNESSLILDLSNLDKGIYYLKTKTSVVKVCKQ